MKALALNAGSTSIKFAVYENDRALGSGELSWSDGQRSHARLAMEFYGGTKQHSVFDVREDSAAAAVVIQSALGLDQENSSISVVGHRIVHGGPQYQKSTLLDVAVKKAIAEWGHLAPQHNSIALQVIQASEAALPEVPQVAVFDTEFYGSLKPRAFLYPLPLDYYRCWGIRRFGFHGISYAYCSQRTAELLHRDLARLNLVICHLGGGCSATAVGAAELSRRLPATAHCPA